MNDEPDWIITGNDRKTPYTEEELEEFVEGFILGLDKEEWEVLKSNYGEYAARKIIKSGFISSDKNNLVNIEPDEGVH